VQLPQVEQRVVEFGLVLELLTPALALAVVLATDR
jgi:hypothetical protein